MKKKHFLLLAALLISIILIIAVSAHSGRTDSKGGHTDHSTGQYHYHHGYSAHQHTNGECPYDFKDKTNHSSSNSNNLATTSEDKELRAFWWITIILAIAAGIAILIIKIIDNRTISKLNTEISSKDSEIRSLQHKIETTKKEIADVMYYANKSIYEITSIPGVIDIYIDGTPIIQDVYTVGITAKTFHCNPNCRGRMYFKHGFYEVSTLSPCSYCVPQELKDFKVWFSDYAPKLNFLAKYKVPIKEQIDYENLSDVVKHYPQYINYMNYRLYW